MKNPLNQTIQTPEQQFFLSKFLRYSFDIVYRKGKEKATDALSQLLVEDEELRSKMKLLAVKPVAEWLVKIRLANESDSWIKKIRGQIVNNMAREGFAIRGDFLMFKLRYCIGSDSELRADILKELHGSRIGGHAGYYRTLHWVRLQFYWVGMTGQVKQFVAECLICQLIKIQLEKPLGFLHPQNIPTAI